MNLLELTRLHEQHTMYLSRQHYGMRATISCPCSGLSAAHISILAASITCGGKYLSIQMVKHLDAGEGLGTQR